ncbi:MAG: tyrosine-type recombinase/integrase [Phycisphaerae bacterium]
MKPSKSLARERIGQISLYQHHGAWYTYHRDLGKAVRLNWGTQLARAQVAASLLNAGWVAAQGNVIIDIEMAAVLAGIPGIQTLGTSSTGVGAPTAMECATTIPALRQAFLDHHEKVLGSSMATVNRYRAATAYLELFAIRSKCTSATSLDASAFVEFLRSVNVASNGHSHTTRRRLRDRGIRYILETCRSLYRFGLQKGMLPKDFVNPFSALGIGHFKVRDRRPVFVFDAEQELAFLRAADLWGFAVHLTLAKTGLRPGELVHLLIEEVDLDGGWLHDVSKAELGWTIKTGRERQVPLVSELVTLPRHVIGTRKAGPVFMRARLWGSLTPSSLAGNRRVFGRVAEERLSAARTNGGHSLSRTEEARILRGIWRDAGATKEDRVRNSFISISKKIGIEATCPKSWRHTFATLLQQANAEVLVRQITLGHKPSSPEDSVLGMTGNYTHTTPELQRREIERALRLRPQSLALVHTRLEGREKDTEV